MMMRRRRRARRPITRSEEIAEQLSRGENLKKIWGSSTQGQGHARTLGKSGASEARGACR